MRGQHQTEGRLLLSIEKSVEHLIYFVSLDVTLHPKSSFYYLSMNMEVENALPFSSNCKLKHRQAASPDMSPKGQPSCLNKIFSIDAILGPARRAAKSPVKALPSEANDSTHAFIPQRNRSGDSESPCGISDPKLMRLNSQSPQETENRHHELQSEERTISFSKSVTQCQDDKEKHSFDVGKTPESPGAGLPGGLERDPSLERGICPATLYDGYLSSGLGLPRPEESSLALGLPPLPALGGPDPGLGEYSSWSAYSQSWLNRHIFGLNGN